MKNYGLLILTVGITFLCLSLTIGCTENKRAKTFGGSMTINIANCQKLVTPTWKDSNLWYATRPMRNGELPETTTFKEESNFGVLEGSIIFVETCK